MSGPLQVSRLWPVLTAMGGLIAGALVLEQVAQDRTVRPLLISIRASAAMGAGDGDPEEDPALAEEVVDPRQAQARVLGRRGETAAAAEQLRAVVTDHPAEAGAWAELSYWLIVSGQGSEALAAIDRALAIRPDEARWALRRGVALGRLGRDAEAEESFARALSLRETLDRARILLSTRLRRRGQLKEAREVLIPATKRGGNDERAVALVELGRLLLLEGKTREAARAFERGVALAPAVPELRVRIGRAWLFHGKTEDARIRGLAVLEQAAVLAPDLPEVHNALGRAYERMKRPDDARLAYMKTLSLDEGNLLAHRRLLRLEMNVQAFAAAQRHVDHLLAIDGGNPEHHFLAGLLATRAGQIDKARAAYRKAIALREGKYPKAYFNLGTLERRAGAPAAAIAAYEAAIAQRPGYLAALNNLGLVLADADRLDEAEAAFERAIAIDPKYAPAHLNLGKVRSARGDHQAAVASFERARAIRGDYPAAELDLGVAYLRMGEVERAIAIYQALVERHPRYLRARYNLGLALKAAHRGEEARAAFEAAVALDPTHVASLRQLAAVATEMKQPERALSPLQDLLDYQPGDLEARLDLAQTYLALRDLPACRRELLVVRAAKADHPRLPQLEAACASP